MVPLSFWGASFIIVEWGGVRSDVSGYQILFERLRDSAFIFRWYPCMLIGLTVRAGLDDFGRMPFLFSSWVEGFERFDLSFCPTRASYGWQRLLDICHPNLFRNEVYPCFQKAFSERDGVGL